MKRRLIGMVTPHYAYNYGAKIQAWALAEAFRILGFDIEYINRRRPVGYEAGNIPLIRGLRIKQELYNNDNFFKFEHTYLQPQTKPLYSNQDFKDLDLSKYYALTVGSDQMWRDDYFHASFEYTPYLYFAENLVNLKRIAYAVSFGKNSCEYNTDVYKRILELIGKFDAISVREKSGIEILKKKFKIDNAVWVADPTLLHSMEKYIETFNLIKKPILNESIASYILHDTPKTFVFYKRIGSIIGLPFNHIIKPKGSKLFNNKLTNKLPHFHKMKSMEEWFSIFLNSRFIVTDSFHGTVFSIIFHKQFITMDNSVGGSERLKSLLSLVGLQDRMFHFNDNVSMVCSKLKQPIDYSIVDERLLPFIKKSWNFLQMVLD